MPEDEPKTSTQYLRKVQFQDKLTILNKEFMKQLNSWIQQCPHYDLTPTLKSYIDHVKKLDKTYGDRLKSPVATGESASTPGGNASGRKIIKAKRRITGEGTPLSDVNKSLVVSSTPATTNPPKFRLSDVSAITPFVQHNSPSVKVAETPAEPPAPAPATGNRKRAIRGGGPAGENESVVFRGADSSSASSMKTSTSAGLTNLPQLPKATPGFWNLSGKPVDADNEKEKEDKGVKEEKKTESATDKPMFPSLSSFSKGPFTFGKSSDVATTGKKDEPAKATFPSFTFGGASKPTSDSTSAPGENKKEEEKEKPKTSFPSFGSTTVGGGGSSLFGSSATPLFGNAAPAAGASAGVTPFSFGTLPAPNTGDDKGEDEDAEYVPPKAEVVENAEPGATYSTKCSVFKLVEKSYTKLGVGMLHLKENDGKKSVLVRAATTVGTVWINSLMNKSLKVTKMDDVKLRLTCPASATEMNTFLVRFASAKEADRVREEIEKENQ